MESIHNIAEGKNPFSSTSFYKILRQIILLIVHLGIF